MNESRSTNPSLMPVMPEPAPDSNLPVLDTDSVSLLARLERQLHSGKTPLSTKALALAAIKAQGLARIHQLTFGDYCERRLRIKRSRVHQLIEFALLLKATAGDGTLPPADSERQLRPLKQLPREVWAAAWAEATHTARAGKITGKHVQAVVDARLAKMQPVQDAAPPPASDLLPAQVITPTPTPALMDLAMPVPSSTPQPTPGAHEFTRTVPAPGVAMPGWKPEWERMIRNTSRPPGALSASVFGWQAPD